MKAHSSTVNERAEATPRVSTKTMPPPRTATPTPPTVTGQDAERQLEKTTDQQRHRGQQPDLRVTQPQVAPDKGERGSLGSVNQLVGELDGERDGENGKCRPSASSETHADHATANPAGCLWSVRRGWAGGAVRRARPSGPSPCLAMLGAPDQPQPGPVVVDGGRP